MEKIKNNFSNIIEKIEVVRDIENIYIDREQWTVFFNFHIKSNVNFSLQGYNISDFLNK